jgi:hypothetical protein
MPKTGALIDSIGSSGVDVVMEVWCYDLCKEVGK